MTRSKTSLELNGRRFTAVVLAAVLLVTAFADGADAKGKKKPKKNEVAEQVVEHADPHQIVVKLAWRQDPQMVAERVGARLVGELIPSRRIVVFEVDAPSAVDAAERLEREWRISWAEADSIGGSPEADGFHAWPSETRPRWSNKGTWKNQPAVDELELDRVHREATGAGVKVAVLDTGVDEKHPDLRGSVRLRLDVIDDDWVPHDVGNGRDDDGDGHVDEAVGHGTHVAGIIRLVAPGATIHAYRVLDSDGKGSVFGVAEAIRHAVDDGVDVINLSFGAEHDMRSRVLDAAIDYAEDNDVLIVAAAGNSGSKDERYPASEKNVLAVGAVTPDGKDMARFASRGKWVDVAAPGISITSTVPGGGHATWSGSSMAAPFVSAEAALLLEKAPNLKVKKLIKLIRDKSRKKNKGIDTDKGLIDIEKALEHAK